MKLLIQHKTHYRFDDIVPAGLQRLRLMPTDTPGQVVHEWHVEFVGAEKQVAYMDAFGNQTILAKFLPATQDVSIVVRGHVETSNLHGVFGKDRKDLPNWLYRESTMSTRAGVELRKFAKSFGALDGSIERLHELMAAIRDRVAYKIGATSVDTTAEDAWNMGAGVCQDHAHIMISVARLMGYQARYISGYLLIDGVIEQEATHAWCEIYVGGLGWTGFDVSNGISPDERYVRLAVGRDYEDAAPIQGLRYGNAQESLDVSLQINQ